MDMKLTIDGLEKERDFYFGKLRDIELICQENENDNNPVLGKIIHILYATEVTLARPSALTVTTSRQRSLLFLRKEQVFVFTNTTESCYWK